MSYYDHATHLALRLDQWDMRGSNGALDEALARDIHLGAVRQVPPFKSAQTGKTFRVWRILKGWRRAPAA